MEYTADKPVISQETRDKITAYRKEKGAILASFMGKKNYKYEWNNGGYVQRFNPDGTPLRNPGTANVNRDVYGRWNPFTDWNDLMEILNKIEELGYQSSVEKIEDEYRCRFRRKHGGWGYSGYSVISKKEATVLAVLEFIDKYTKFDMP